MPDILAAKRSVGFFVGEFAYLVDGLTGDKSVPDRTARAARLPSVVTQVAVHPSFINAVTELVPFEGTPAALAQDGHFYMFAVR